MIAQNYYYPPLHLVFPNIQPPTQTMKDYIQNAIRTESIPEAPILTQRQVRLLHAAMGLTTETGEFMDALKKQMFYGREVDEVNLIEEIGDLFWYLAIACDELGVSFEEVQQKNIAKLMLRYPEKFSKERAENRNLMEERAILESRESYNALNT